jgi:hypothetical protein
VYGAGPSRPRLVERAETGITFALNVDRDEVDLVDIATGEWREQQIPQPRHGIHVVACELSTDNARSSGLMH